MSQRCTWGLVRFRHKQTSLFGLKHLFCWHKHSWTWLYLPWKRVPPQQKWRSSEKSSGVILTNNGTQTQTAVTHLGALLPGTQPQSPPPPDVRRKHCERHAACFAPRYIYVTFDTQMNLRLLRRHYPLTLHPAEWAQHIKNSAALPAWPFLFALFCLQARPGVWLRNHNFLRRFFTVLDRFLKCFSLWLELRPIEMFFKTLYRRVYWGKMMQPEKEAIVQNAWKSLHLKAT